MFPIRRSTISTRSSTGNNPFRNRISANPRKLRLPGIFHTGRERAGGGRKAEEGGTEEDGNGKRTDGDRRKTERRRQRSQRRRNGGRRQRQKEGRRRQENRAATAEGPGRLRAVIFQLFQAEKEKYPYLCRIRSLTLKNTFIHGDTGKQKRCVRTCLLYTSPSPRD